MKEILLLAALLVSLPISDAAEIGGHNRKDVAASQIVEPRGDRKTNITERSISPDTIPQKLGLVGPSGQEIHDFLYPTGRRCESCNTSQLGWPRARRQARSVLTQCSELPELSRMFLPACVQEKYFNGAQI
jgi:hypothetical protein